MYESEKKILQRKGGKFSLKKLFKLQGLADISNAEDDLTAEPENKFIDKEHEREILERQQKAKVRPEIIHPLDLLNGGVEVVKITPKNLTKGQLEKQKMSLASKASSGTKLAQGSKNSDSDSSAKDSGHDTSSIQTETDCSDGNSSNSGLGDFGPAFASIDFSPSLTPVGGPVVPEVSCHIHFFIFRVMLVVKPCVLIHSDSL